MESLFKSLPQWAIAILILLAGIVFFYIVMPPHTVCDSQAEIFKAAQTPFLFLDSKKKYITTVGIVSATDNCKRGNSHGACRELFDGLKHMMLDLRVVPEECNSQIGGIAQVKSAIMSSLELFAMIAWTDKAPKSTYEKLGWYDTSHVSVYCALKRLSVEYYGQDNWNDFVNSILPKLPLYSELTREEAWPRTLFSVNCDQYR